MITKHNFEKIAIFKDSLRSYFFKMKIDAKILLQIKILKDTKQCSIRKSDQEKVIQ